MSLVSLESKTHFEFTSDYLTNALNPCFINGEAHFLAVGGAGGGKFEIWDIQKQASIRVLQVDGGFASSMASTKNIFVLGSSKKKLYLWDVRSWEMFHSLDLDGMDPQSLHLTTDAKYMTIGGWNGDLCIIFSIQ